MKIKKIKKTMGLFLINQGGVLKVHGIKEIDITEKTVDYNGVITLNISIKPFEYKDRLYYFFDIVNREHLSFNVMDGLSYDDRTALMDAIVNDHIIRDFITAEKKKMNWLDLILGLVGGVGIGLAIGTFI